MINDGFEEIKIPSNIDEFIEEGVNKARKQRRKNKLKLISLIASLLIISISTFNSIGVSAYNIPIFNDIYRIMGFNDRYISAYEYCGEKIESNGISVTVDKIAASKYFIKMAIKIENSSELEKLGLIHIGAEVNGENIGSSGGYYDVNEHTRVCVINFIKEDGFTNESTINLDINSDEYEINETMPLYVDFEDTEKVNINKEVYTDEDDDAYISGKIQATNHGSILMINRLQNQDFSMDYWINIDGRLYNSGSGSGGDKSINMLYDDINIEDIEKGKNISLILSKNNTIQSSIELADEEKIEAQQKEYIESINEYKKAYLNLPSDTRDNINYVKEIVSKNGEKVYITKVERIDGKVRVEIEADNKDNAFSVAKGLSFDYDNYLEHITDKDYISDCYRGKIQIYKTNTGFVVETLDAIRDYEINLRFNDILLEDNYSYKEIELNLK